MAKHFINDEVKRLDILDERWYQIPKPDGTGHIYVPGTTTYLEAFPKGYAFKQWLKSAGFNADMIVKIAGDFGSAFHQCCEMVLKDDSVKISGSSPATIEGVAQYPGVSHIDVYERFLIWCSFMADLYSKYEFEVDPGFVEYIVWDYDGRNAGTVDWKIDLKDRKTGEEKKVIVDWKSGNYIGDESEMQISEYARMTELVTSQKIDEAWIAWFPRKKPNKKGYRIKVIEKDEIIQNADDFRHVVKVWERANPNPKPRYRSVPTEISMINIQKNQLTIED